MNTIFQTLFKNVLVGMVFVIAVILGGLIVGKLSLSLPEVKDAQASLLWFFVGGVIAGPCLGPTWHPCLRFYV